MQRQAGCDRADTYDSKGDTWTRAAQSRSTTAAHAAVAIWLYKFTIALAAGNGITMPSGAIATVGSMVLAAANGTTLSLAKASSVAGNSKNYAVTASSVPANSLIAWVSSAYPSLLADFTFMVGSKLAGVATSTSLSQAIGYKVDTAATSQTAAGDSCRYPSVG